MPRRHTIPPECPTLMARDGYSLGLVEQWDKDALAGLS